MTQVTGPALGVYDSAGLEWGPGTYISNQLSWDAAAADPNETRGLRLPFCRLSVEGGAERKAHCWRGCRDAEHGTHPSGPVPCFSFGVAGGRIHQSRGTWWQGPTSLSGVHKSIFPSKSEAIEDNKWERQCPNKTLFRKTDGESDVDPGP